MAMAESPNVVLERPLVFEVRSTKAIPYFATVLLVGPPVAFHSEGLAAFSAHVGFGAVLPLVMSLQGSEILQRPCSWVVYVVLAVWCTTETWEP